MTRVLDKGHPHPGQEWTHGWKRIHPADVVADATHHFSGGTVASAVHGDGSIHLIVNPDGERRDWHLHAEDVPSLVDSLDEALGNAEAGRRDVSTVKTTAGDVDLAPTPTGDGVHVTFGHGDEQGDLRLSTGTRRPWPLTWNTSPPSTSRPLWTPSTLRRGLRSTCCPTTAPPFASATAPTRSR